MTGEKEAPDHIVNANKMVDAPAEMPGVEEIARAIASWRHHLTPANPYRPSILPSERAQADAVMALFAPILAEKEREIGQAKSAALLQGANIDVMNAAVDTARDFVRQAKAAEARALAAEAALAAERERCALIADDNADNDSRGDSPYDNGAGSCGYRKACYDIASAIRAEGE